MAGMPAARARAALRCCDGQSVFTSGNSGGAVAGRDRHDFDLGAGGTGTGLDEPAKRDRFGRADGLESAGTVISEQSHHKPCQVSRVNDLDRLQATFSGP
jgi:hypothetical protein